MEFHSVRFAAFLAVVFALYWSLVRLRAARYALLLVASYVFYAGWGVWCLGLIAFSSVLDFTCGARIAASERRGAKRAKRGWLLASLAGNLGLLCYFKYTAWGADGLARLFDTLGLTVADGFAESWAWRAAVPVGISFYTFQTLSYTIDVYRGVLKPVKSFGEFALFVAFFPQLVAGPIVRAVEFLPQLDVEPRFDRERLHDGLYRIAIGLVKKVMLADVIGRALVDPFYAQPDAYVWWLHPVALVGFAFQLYGDFAGYSDIAIGSARLLGFDLPENFDGPYRARSVREYWRRWHITLSSWVRDYVYFPLGGSRGTRLRIARNLMITMLLLALWHGASMLWVIFGLMHGSVMVFERALEDRRGGRPFVTTPLRSALAWTATFAFLCTSFFCVRGQSLDQLGAVFTSSGATTNLPTAAWAALAAAVATHFQPAGWADRFRERLCALPTTLVGVLFGAVCALLVLALTDQAPFIYFQF